MTAKETDIDLVAVPRADIAHLVVQQGHLVESYGAMEKHMAALNGDVGRLKEQGAAQNARQDRLDGRVDVLEKDVAVINAVGRVQVEHVGEQLKDVRGTQRTTQEKLHSLALAVASLAAARTERWNLWRCASMRSLSVVRLPSICAVPYQ
jgi:hypothetical protein